MYFTPVIFLAAAIILSASQEDEDTNPLAAAATRRCFDLLRVWQCDSSNYSRDSADIALNCGTSYLSYAENFVAGCTKGGDDENNEYCFNLYEDASADLGILDLGPLCGSAVDSTTCSTKCRDLLQASVDRMGCCFRTVFNERLTFLILQHDVNVSLDACDVEAPEPCSPAFPLVAPQNPESCTFDQYWSRIVNYICRKDVAQPQIDVYLSDSFCLPMARHQYNACGRGPNDRYCIDLYGTSFNPVYPKRTVTINADLNDVMIQCANYSKFPSEGCNSLCKSALETAIKNLGCCVNNFNDSVNQVLVPQFSGDVMIACNVESPGVCQNNELSVLGGGSGSIAASITVISLLMPFVLHLNY